MASEWLPRCSCRELGDFQPFGALWLSERGAERGGVPAVGSKLAPSHDAHGGIESSYALFPSSLDGAVEEEFYVAGQSVVHSCGQQIVKVLTESEPVLKALSCSFVSDTLRAPSPELSGLPRTERVPAERRAEYICLLMKKELKIYSAEGDTYAVSLPFVAKNMWVLDGILLLQGAVPPIRTGGHGSTCHSRASLFSLCDPLDEPRPVSMMRESFADALMTDDMVVEYCSETLFLSQRLRPFLVTFNRVSGARQLWIISRNVPRSSAPSASPVRSVSTALPSKAGHGGMGDPGGPKTGGMGRKAMVRDEGDAVSYVHSQAFGWLASGSIGLGADSRSDWSASDAELSMKLVWTCEEARAEARVEASEGFLVSKGRGEVLLALLVASPLQSLEPSVLLYNVDFLLKGGEVRDGSEMVMDNRGSGDAGSIGFGEKLSIPSRLQLAAVLPAIRAVALWDASALEPCVLLLLLKRDGALLLHCGPVPLCQLVLRGTEVHQGRAVGLSHAVGCRVNLRLAAACGNEVTARMEVPSVSSVLVRRALLQVKNNVSETLYWLIRRRLLALMAPLVSCEQTRDALQPETEPGRRDAPGSEWSAFAAVMLSLVAQAGYPVGAQGSAHLDALALLLPFAEAPRKPPRASLSTSTDVKGVLMSSPSGSAFASEGSSWSKLLASPHHKRALAEGSLPHTLSRAQDDGSSPPLHSCHSPQDLLDKLHEIFGHGWTAECWPGSDKDLRTDLTRILPALHCLHEDMKLNVLLHSSIPGLAGLLIVIATALGASSHADYYVRYHPQLSQLLPPEPAGGVGIVVDQEDATEDVPDICQWLTDRFQGRNISAAVFADPGLRVLPATRKVCTLVACLLGDNATEDCGLWIQAKGKPVGEPPSMGRAESGIEILESFEMGQGPMSLFNSKQLLRNASGLSAADLDHLSTHQPQTLSFSLRSEASGILRQQSSASLGPDTSDDGGKSKRLDRCESVVETMISLGMGLKDIDVLPLSVAIPIRECLWACRVNPPKAWPPQAYELVSRGDLAAPICSRPVLVSGIDSKHSNLVAEMAADRAGGGGIVGGSNDGSPDASNTDGTRMEGDFARLRFGKDRRLVEVRRCLSAAHPVRLRIPNNTDITDHDIHAAHQARLQLLARRTLSLAVGRGMFTLGLATPLPTEALDIPPLQLGGRLPQNDALIKLDLALLPADHAAWPEFHNGVAAALRLALGQTSISRTWIVYNKPEAATYAHAGVLMGLGLQGHLKALANTDLYSYLCLDHEATQIGIMLGMAVSKRATMDEAVFKMLYVHIPSLHPANYPDLEVSSAVQTAAIMGIGLLYQGSKNRRMAEMLLGEIGRRASNDRLQDREGYSLAAGLALGLVCLGQGNQAAGLADLHIENTLRKYIAGGRADQPSAAAANTLSNVTDPTLCCRVKEGDNVNLDVTAPGATLALGLMYLKTNNTTVASRLTVPKTHFLLQYLRPDLVLLRVLARNLVMWDQIVPTTQFVEDHMPEIVKGAYDGKSKEANQMKDADSFLEDLDTLRHVHANIVAGCCMSIGLRYAGSGESKSMTLLLHYIDHFKSLRAKCEGHRRIDKQLIETCLAIAALSAALVMAGTGDLQLLRHLRALRSRVDADLNYGHHMAFGMAIGLLFLGGGRATLCTSNEAIGALVVSLYPRFPISTSDCRYHLQAFRHLYVLAVEHRCLEAIDLDSKLLCAVPVEIQLKQSPEYAEVCWRAMTPCILPELSRVKSIRVCSERYWKVTWDVDNDARLAKALRRGSVLTVQRKTGHLSYSEDPFGLRNLHARPVPRRTKCVQGVAPFKTDGHADLVQAFSGDPAVLAFAQNFCSSGADGFVNPSMAAGEGSEHDTEATITYTQIVYECLKFEKPEAIHIYAQLLTLSQRPLARNPHWSQVSDLRTILSYYGLLSPCLRSTSADAGSAVPLPLLQQPLIKESFLIHLRCMMEEACEGQRQDLSRYIADGSFPPSDDAAGVRRLTNFLLFHGLPSPARLHQAKAKLSELVKAVGGGSTATVPLVALTLPNVPPKTLVKLAPLLVN